MVCHSRWEFRFSDPGCDHHLRITKLFITRGYVRSNSTIIMATIQLHQVEKKFGEFYAVKPMDLTIADGEFVSLLGPSGCGKTTTLRMISGLETVSGGMISLDGRNVTWRHPSDRNIAFVFQFYALYPHMNARQNISFPLQAEGMDEGDIEKRVEEVVKLLRIESLLETHPGKLSGGDKQRIALARALVRRPA